MRNARVLNASVNHFILSARQPEERIITIHIFFCLWRGYNYWYINSLEFLLWNRRLLQFNFRKKNVFFKRYLRKFVKNTYWSPKITPPKNAFLAVCVYLDETIDLHEVNSRVPFGGNVGAGDSLLHKYLKFSKILRLHAIFQDAHGYMRSNKNIAPGCVYTLTTEKFLKNSMLLSHFLGFFYWTLMKFFRFPTLH